MSVHFIVGITIPDPTNRTPYDRYIAEVRPIVESYGGEYLIRSENVGHVAGDWTPDRVIVVRFPDMQALQSCFASPEYTAIEGLRSGTVNADIVIVADES